MAMKSALTAAALASVAQAGSPIAKVISMVSELQADVIKEGELSQKEYVEFSEFCEDRARAVGHEIKTNKADVETLSATVAEEESAISALNAKVDKLTGHIATADADLKAATDERHKEHEDFILEQKELTTTVDMLVRAIAILEREAASGGASMLQASTANAVTLAQALASMVQASQISTFDADKLSAFVQEAADDNGAPAASVYKSQTGGIVDTLQDLNEKAEGQLDDVRKKEASERGNFELVAQALKDELRFGNDDLTEAKSKISASSERKSTAAGDLQSTQNDLKADLGAREALHHDCMAKAASFEAETKSRGEELKALAEAKRIIKEATGAASLSQVSFVQVASGSSTSMHGEEVESQVMHLVRGLAHQHGSSELMQLSAQMSAAMHAPNPFEKVRGLISDMIAKLEDAATADATKKAYCDKEMSETKTTQADKTNEIKKLTTRSDRMTAQSAQLKEQIAALQSDLANLAGSQAEMDRLRREENTVFVRVEAELAKGLTGIKLALKVLNEYYATNGAKAHEQAEGAASGIIGLLEVCEADFSKNLAQATGDEEQAVEEYDKVSKANQIERTTKVTDVKYKVQESKSLDKSSGELLEDKKGVQAELDAVNEYMSKIEGECIEKAESYATRKARMDSEIAGLKQGLEILETETAFIQQRTNRHALRGHH